MSQPNCPNCGFLNSAEAKYCAECGYQMDSHQMSEVICPVCGTRNAAGVDTCNQCKRLLDRKELEEKIEQELDPSLQMLKRIEEVMTGRRGLSFMANILKPFYKILSFFKSKPCPYCTVKNPPDIDTCLACTAPLDGGELNKIILSRDLWDYLPPDEDPYEIPYMPSLKDRQKVEEIDRETQSSDASATNPNGTSTDKIERLKIWEYFFRFDPDDVGLPQRRYIDQLETYQKTVDRLYAEIKSGQEIFRQRILVVFGIGLVMFVLWQFLIPSSEEVTSFILRLSIFIFQCLAILIPFIAFGVVISLYRKSVATPKAEVEKNRYEIKNLLFRLDSAAVKLANINLDREREVEIIEQKKAELRVQIGKLQAQIPKPVSDDTIRGWLDNDLRILQRESLKRAAFTKGQLPPIGYRDKKTKENIPVPNPLIFISPGEIQEESRLPPPYIPPAELVKPSAKERQRNSSTNNALQAKSQPDRAKHLLARQMASLVDKSVSDVLDKRYYPGILHGVYYIEHLIITENVVTLHGFLFDFIMGRTTTDMMTEQYYTDIVAIEHGREFRTVPLTYGREGSVNVDDAPIFSLTLASGDRRTMTIVNDTYLSELQKLLNDGQELTEGDEEKISQQSNREKESADSAVKVLRQKIRLHKKKMEETLEQIGS